MNPMLADEISRTEKAHLRRALIAIAEDYSTSMPHNCCQKIKGSQIVTIADAWATDKQISIYYARIQPGYCFIFDEIEFQRFIQYFQILITVIVNAHLFLESHELSNPPVSTGSETNELGFNLQSISRPAYKV